MTIIQLIVVFGLVALVVGSIFLLNYFIERDLDKFFGPKKGK